jgi:phosphate transport system substrate-binding protein
LAAAVAADRGGIGFVGLTGIHGVRALAVSHGGDALPPSAQEVAVEDYPLSRRLYLYAPEKMTPLASSLLDFVRSDEAQVIIERAGFVSQRIRAYQPAMRAGSSDVYRNLVDGAVRLSVNFRFNPASAALDNKSQQDIDRLQVFMRQPEQRGKRLILIGFADGAEVMPVQAEQLSSERADQVAAALLAYQIPVERVRGVGDTAPVAPRSSALGQVRNRRVEVWMRDAN